jgi:YidC/Oxa1 family membrane protein insertase
LNPWELIIQQPVINVLIVMSHYLADNFGLAIIALTIIVNLCMLPLTLRQIQSTKAMQEIQPKLAELQKKYGKDRQKMAQEQMRLYKESGIRPAGCAITMIIQMPVWIALYQSIMLTLAVAPEGLLNLAKYLYPWPVVYSVLPLSRDFLWMNLAEPDLFLAIMVGGTMWLQQKMSMTMPTDPKQRSQSQMMLWMMPLMFTFLALSFPSGLSLFWTASSVVRIVMQYRITGWGGLTRGKPKEADKDKKYLQFEAPAVEKSSDDVGADIVIRDGEQMKPSKIRYQPGKDRTRHRRKR